MADVAGMVRVDESNARNIEKLRSREAADGRPALNDTRLANWLMEEGARALGLLPTKGGGR